MTTPYIFVFGSNQAGRHGKGSAKEALNRFGAVYGQAEGRQGQSYGIPTKDRFIQTLPLAKIRPGVDRFLAYARSMPQETFKVVNVGCMLAGYRPEEIAPMFQGAPANCFFSEEFASVLEALGEQPGRYALLDKPAPAHQGSLF